VNVLRTILIILGVLLLIGGAIGTGAHYATFVGTTVTRIASFTPYFVVLTITGTAAVVLARQWVLAVLGVLLVVVGLASQWPLYRAKVFAPHGPDAAGANIRLLQANILFGRADATALTDLVRRQQVDIVTVIELTPQAVDRLSAAGLGEVLPYSYLRPAPGGGGSGIYSRFPLRDGQLLADLSLNNVRATVSVPGAPDTVVFALHPVPPFPEPAGQWARELSSLRPLLAASARPVVVGADFNATWDHRLYRDLLVDGGPAGSAPLRDAAEVTGAGIVATYPANRWYPALIAIDHVLAAGLTPTSVRRVDLPGSDHHGIITDLRFG